MIIFGIFVAGILRIRELRALRLGWGAGGDRTPRSGDAGFHAPRARVAQVAAPHSRQGRGSQGDHDSAQTGGI